MARGSTLDEEEDRKNLITSNNRHVLQIENFRSIPIMSFPFPSLNFNKFYLLVISLPLLILAAYLIFTGANRSAERIRMIESEIQALHLLKLQQSQLLNLLKVSSDITASSLIPLNSSGTGPESPQDGYSSIGIKDKLLMQLDLNKKIQQILLSTHISGELYDMEGYTGDHSDTSIGNFSRKRCESVSNYTNKERIDWSPQPDKFLFAICVSGQMSNHLICLEKHMFIAAILNRVLILPSSKIDYQYNKVVNLEKLNNCFGKKVVITFEEFSALKKVGMGIDRFICYFSSPVPCYLDDDHFKKLASIGISVGKVEVPWSEDVKEPSRKSMADVKSAFSSSLGIIAIGDVFYADLEKEMVMQPGGPLVHKCRTLIEPNHLIFITAQRFVQTFLGRDFIALHFRRHGFLKFCNAKAPSCFFPIPQAAACISGVAERVNTPIIYLSTDAAESETTLLQSLITLKGKPAVLVRKPARDAAEKWDSLLYRHGIEQDSQVEAMLDKCICALSRVFVGSYGSTFTDDIRRLRKDLGYASNCDQFLCRGQPPSFIAAPE